MRKRYLAAVVGIAAMSSALVGCGGLNTGTGTSTSTADAAAKPASCSDANPYLAVALPNLTNPYYVAMKQGFEDEGQRPGSKLRCK